MRRKDKRVESQSDLIKILRGGEVCYLSMACNGKPYVVPLNYGYADGALYFHSAPEGRKIEVLKADPEVCFTIVSDYRLVRGENACSWSAGYRSVIGTGKARIFTDPEDKKKGLAILMGQYSDREFDITGADLENVVVIRVDIEEITGKHS
jgi:nitroimidazol reductase NimA-like FMN-containing flavoprotein (pyridoxamine 5'-phosphate oxidase superfamily)